MAKDFDRFFWNDSDFRFW